MLGDLYVCDLDVLAWCNRCSQNDVVPIKLLIARLGPTVPVPEVGSRMLCTSCGSKDVATRLEWSGIGIVARHDPSKGR